MDDMFSWITLAIGAYLLFCGITGKGKMLYDTANIKKGMEALYLKRVRKIALPLGVSMLLQSAMEFMAMGSEVVLYRTLSLVFFGLNAIGIAALIVIAVRMTDRTKSTKPGAPKPASKAAFEFDEEDEEG